MKGICSELDATWSHGIFEDRDKMMLFARVGIHLGLLGDAGGIEFLMRSNRRNLDRWLVRGLLEGIVDVRLMRGTRRRGNEGASFAVCAICGIEGYVWCELLKGKGGEKALDLIVMSTGGV